MAEGETGSTDLHGAFVRRPKPEIRGSKITSDPDQRFFREQDNALYRAEMEGQGRADGRARRNNSPSLTAQCLRGLISGSGRDSTQ